MTRSKRTFVATIDGPAASGKSTTARLAARRLGWLYLDTGAMYRGLTVKVLESSVDLADTDTIGRLAETTDIRLEPSSDRTRILVDGKDRTDAIRTPDVDKAVGPVCEVPRVREIMVSLQRKTVAGRSVIAEGRDMGTVVFPDADVKFYMVASPGERAKRRQLDLEKLGVRRSLSLIEQELRERDSRDSRRAHSPLKPAKDALLIDTTTLDLDEQIAFVLGRIQEAIESSGQTKSMDSV